MKRSLGISGAGGGDRQQALWASSHLLHQGRRENSKVLQDGRSHTNRHYSWVILLRSRSRSNIFLLPDSGSSCSLNACTIPEENLMTLVYIYWETKILKVVFYKYSKYSIFRLSWNVFILKMTHSNVLEVIFLNDKKNKVMVPNISEFIWIQWTFIGHLLCVRPWVIWVSV